MSGPPVRILIVEDSPLNMELARDLLENAGFTVLQAGTAEDGLAQIRRDPPDLVLMDIRLPGMDGRSAVQALKDDPATRPIPVIALTAQAMKGDAAASRAAGFDGYITKPIDTRAFVRVIRAHLPGGAG